MVQPKSVYIAFEAFPRPKGASSHIASMVSALAGSHGPVLLLCLGFGDMPAVQVEGNITIRRFKAYHPNMLKRSEGFSDFVFDCLDKVKEAIDLCVFRDPWGGVAALSHPGFYHTVFEVNALPSWELAYTYPEFHRNIPLKHKIEDMEYFCLKNSSKILTVSHVTQEALTDKGVSADKTTVIPNSAPDVFFHAPPHEEKPECIESGRWIGYFGSLHSWQGVEDAVAAFSLIAGAHDHVNMIIVTGGRKEAKKILRKQIRKKGLDKRVLIHPPVAAEKLAAIVRHLEFTVAPLKDTPRNTKQGCCPVKIIESMSAGVPVIASDLSCVRPIIDDKTNGLLVPPENNRALALAMGRMLQETAMAKALGHKAKMKAAADFSRQKIHHDLSLFFNRAACPAPAERVSI